jgi:membrane-bound ClpP family serine protease
LGAGGRQVRVFARYLVLQIPGQFIAAVTLVMLVRWTELTPMLAGLLAPEQTGYVRVGAELWRAQLCGGERVAKGAAVRVTEVRDLTLQVEPERR